MVPAEGGTGMTDSSYEFPRRRAEKRILCIGMPVRDLTFNVDAVPGRGQKFNADRFDRSAAAMH